jgi:serine/threonine protein kinase
LVEQLAHYRLERRLAVGGMAEVFLARDLGPKSRGRICVVKRMLPWLSEDATFIRMLLDEARIVAQLSHPNIAKLYDVGEYGGAYFLVIEYVAGASLRQIIDDCATRGRPVPWPVAARIVRDVANGLHCAHEALGPDGAPLRIVHRDVSPQNILVSTAGRVKLIDFGIAKAVGSARTATGMFKGKLAYMSPEQVPGTSVDRRSDVYSLGLVLYELLTGRTALQIGAGSPLGGILNPRFPPAERFRPDLPMELRRAVKRATSKEVGERFATALDFARAMERLLASSAAALVDGDIAAMIPPAALAAAADAPSEMNVELLLAPTVLSPRTRRLEPDEEPKGAVGWEAPTTPFEMPNPPRRSAADPRRRKVWTLGLGIAATLLLFGTGIWHSFNAPKPPPAPHLPTLVVLDLENRSGNPDKSWLGRALSEQLRARLEAGGAVRVISGDEISRTWHSMAGANGDLITPATLRELGAALDADWVATGSFSFGEAGAGALAIQMLVDYPSGAPATPLSQVLGTELELSQLADNLSSEMRLTLGIPVPSADQGGGDRQALSSWVTF